MSKIGKKIITIPQGVEVSIKNGLVSVKGPKGQLEEKISDLVKVEIVDGQIKTSIADDDNKNYRGLTRTLIMNLIDGVTKGFEKKLILTGVGYNAKLEGKKIIFSLGLSHKVSFLIPQDIDGKVEQDQKGNYIIALNSIKKQYLGRIVAEIRELKKPEPYKGKGIRYFDEFIKLKAGKTAKK